VVNVLHETLPTGNYLAGRASLIIVAYTYEVLDCVVWDRACAAFGTGMATFSIIMAATGMGLVAHPIAWINPLKSGRGFEYRASSRL